MLGNAELTQKISTAKIGRYMNVVANPRLDCDWRHDDRIGFSVKTETSNWY